ncbi:MAG: hypothetical protein HQM08_24815 [Candidatus Riflebacteria bacterium]|nr:hypothetical protein [Candidatus Riflebacteria bacterium]
MLNNLSQVNQEIVSTAKSLYYEHPKLAATVIIILFLTFLYFLMPSSLTPVQSPKGTPIFAVKNATAGKIIQSGKSSLTLLGDDGKTFILIPKAGVFLPDLKSGTKIKVNYIPYRISRDGSILGQCLDIIVE